MTHSTNIPSFNAVASSLSELKVAISASEAHGLLCGLLAGGEIAPLRQWLEMLQSEGPVNVESLSASAKKTFNKLLNASEGALRDEDESFTILLPAKDVAFEDRARSLGEWCNGFVTGLGLSGCYINEKSNKDVAEVLQDLIDIGKITVFDGGSEEEIQAFKEVVDYVEVAVLMLYRSLQFTDEAANLLTETLH